MRSHLRSDQVLVFLGYVGVIDEWSWCCRIVLPFGRAPIGIAAKLGYVA
jgi:hypothetical protein